MEVDVNETPFVVFRGAYLFSQHIQSSGRRQVKIVFSHGRYIFFLIKFSSPFVGALNRL